MNVTRSGSSIAMAALALLISGASLPQTAAADSIIGHCFGVNACKG